MSSDRRKQYNDEIRAQTARRREYEKGVAVRVTIAFAVAILFASVIVPYLSTRIVAYSIGVLYIRRQGPSGRCGTGGPQVPRSVIAP
jgi:hypothetical protein